MRDSKEPLDKLFYYSGVYGLLSRIYNEEYNPLLVYIHMLLQVSHGTIDTKVREILRGIEPVIKIPDHYFEILENTIEALCTNYLDIRTNY